MMENNLWLQGAVGRTPFQSIEVQPWSSWTQLEQIEEQMLQLGNSLLCNLCTWFQNLAQACADVIVPAVRHLLQSFAPQKHRKPRKRSSRRLKVQAKRKRLGLSVDGKLPPVEVNGKRYHYSRKQSYTIALYRERVSRMFDLPPLQVGA